MHVPVGKICSAFTHPADQVGSGVITALACSATNLGTRVEYLYQSRHGCPGMVRARSTLAMADQIAAWVPKHGKGKIHASHGDLDI